MEPCQLVRSANERGADGDGPWATWTDAEQPAVGVELERLATQPSSNRRELDLVRVRVVEGAPHAANHGSHQHRADVIDEQPPRADGEPRLDVASSENLAQLDCRACGANDVVFVRPIRAERRDQLHARLW